MRFSTDGELVDPGARQTWAAVSIVLAKLSSQEEGRDEKTEDFAVKFASECRKQIIGERMMYLKKSPCL